MKILIVDDHTFYSHEIVEKLLEDGHIVKYAKNYKEAEAMVNSSMFDVSFLDIILQNGSTGVHLAETYGEKLGRIMFITGCTDEITLRTVGSKYATASKMTSIWGPIKKFLNGERPSIL